MQLVIDPDSPTLSPHQLDEVAAALHHPVAGRPAFTLWAAPYVGTHNPALDLAPDEPFDQVVDLTRRALDQVLGQKRSTYQPTAAHITTGYCHTAADSGPVANALRASRPSQAPVTITRLALVMVTHDPEGPSYRWHNPPLATIDLHQERLPCA